MSEVGSLHVQARTGLRERPRVLIVNCYFPEAREPLRLTREVPNSLAPVLLAGVFSERCDVRLWNEVSDGFLERHAEELLGWPDLLVLTGLTAAFDRMLHVTAHVRTRAPRVVVVAGGLAVRALPRHASRFFDHACRGDVEQLREVAADLLGADFVSDELRPRHDLARWSNRNIAYVESSRNCNFRCSFCSLTADARAHDEKGADYLRRQVEAIGRSRILFFQDNQFVGPNREAFLERMDLLKDLRSDGRFLGWSGFVTSTFFWDDENLRLARETGCFSLFVGVESFDERWLERVNKKVNARRSQRELIRRCLEAGILFQYGLVFDPSEMTLQDMRRELEVILDDPDIPAPNYIFLATPFPGTPFFRDRHDRGLLLPGTKVRDLEGSTLTLRPLDPPKEVAEFVRTTKNLRDMRAAMVRHQSRFLWRHRDNLSGLQLLASTITAGSILFPTFVSNPAHLLQRMRPRTHVSTTDRLDDVYRPRLRVDSQYEGYFRPTPVTDAAGRLADEVAEDLLDARYALPRAAP